MGRWYGSQEATGRGIIVDGDLVGKQIGHASVVANGDRVPSGGRLGQRGDLFAGRLFSRGDSGRLPVAAHLADEVGAIVFGERVAVDRRIDPAGWAKDPTPDAAGRTGQAGGILRNLRRVKGAEEIVAARVSGKQRAVGHDASPGDTLGDEGGVKGRDAIDPAG